MTSHSGEVVTNLKWMLTFPKGDTDASRMDVNSPKADVDAARMDTEAPEIGIERLMLVENKPIKRLRLNKAHGLVPPYCATAPAYFVRSTQKS